MTEIIRVLNFQSVSHCASQSVVEKMCLIFTEKKLNYQQQKEKIFVLLGPGFFNSPSTSNLQALLRCQFSHHILSFKMTVLSEEGVEIRANSQHQKTASIKFINKINMSTSYLALQGSPLTGEFNILFKIFLCGHENIDFTLVLNELYNLLKQSSEILQQFLQFMEIIPLQQNAYLIKFHQSLNNCKMLEKNEKQPLYISSQNGCEHGYFFIVPMIENRIESEAENFVDLTAKKMNLIKGFYNKMIVSPYHIKKSNWIYLQLAQNQILQELKKMIVLSQNPRFKSEICFQNFEGRFDCIVGPPIDLEFIFKPLQQIQEEYRICERLAKMNYISFIHEYVSSKNYQLIQKKYIIRRKSNSYIKLKDYLKKNKLTISYLTKLNLCCSITNIAQICKQDLKKIRPSLQLHNINVFQLNDLKINKLNTLSENFELQVSESCFQILFGRQHGETRLKTSSKLQINKWYHFSREVDGGYARFEGPSPVLYIAKQILFNNMQSPLSSTSSLTRYSIQQILYVFVCCFQQLEKIYYHKVFNFEEQY